MTDQTDPPGDVPAEPAPLHIPTPCHRRWSELRGSGPRRLCDECAVHVVDGSAMTREAAVDHARSAEGRVCMRLELDGEGRPVHAPGTPPVRPGLLGLGLGAMALAACVHREAQPAQEPGEALEITVDAVSTRSSGADTPDWPSVDSRGVPREIVGLIAFPPAAPPAAEVPPEETDRDER